MSVTGHGVVVAGWPALIIPQISVPSAIDSAYICKYDPSMKSITPNQAYLLSACYQWRSVPEMIRRVKDEHGVSIARGSVYVTIDRLESAGLITTRLQEVPSRGGRPQKRRFAMISADGQAALDRFFTLAASVRRLTMD